MSGKYRATVIEYLESNKILSSLQYGFRTGNGTTRALLQVTDDVWSAMDCGQVIILTLLVLSNLSALITHCF